MNKIKSLVMVKSISRGHNILKYITPNARLLGMNVDALMAGNKLTEDYIHPQDRARVIQNAKNVLKSGGSDYEDEYRIVDDYGCQMGSFPEQYHTGRGFFLYDRVLYNRYYREQEVAEQCRGS